MAPDDRRAAIVAATLPLLREYGPSVSTRQIADAAGVAEGTIFGVFPDKGALIRAALLTAFDPDPVLRALAGIDPAADLRDRLTRAVDIVADRLAENGPLLVAVRVCAPDPAAAGDFLSRLAASRGQMIRGIAAVIEPDSAALRRSPTTAARLLLSIVFAATRDSLGDD
jgi:AcrR family transcriptional regulator